MDRRQFIGKTVALGVAIPSLTLLGGCADLIRAIAGTCPDNADEAGDIAFVPSVLHPVFAGFQDVTTADGAPGTARIWYPTLEGFNPGPPILKMCLVRWPVILFLHGMPPPRNRLPCPNPEYHKTWVTIPNRLARSGYVVIVPPHGAQVPFGPLAANAFPLPFLDWIRTGWENRRWVDSRKEATGVAGHSNGALLAARVANAFPEIAAFAGLGGSWSELNDVGNVFRTLDAASLLMHTNDGLESTDALSGVLQPPTYDALYPGDHFDYISDVPNCPETRGACSLFEHAAADLIALFFGRHLPVPVAQPQVPIGLDPAPVAQTTQQRFFSGGHLTGDGRMAGLTAFAGGAGCRIDLQWRAETSGSRVIGA